jgi:hypothetical protein
VRKENGRDNVGDNCVTEVDFKPGSWLARLLDCAKGVEGEVKSPQMYFTTSRSNGCLSCVSAIAKTRKRSNVYSAGEASVGEASFAMDVTSAPHMLR